MKNKFLLPLALSLAACATPDTNQQNDAPAARATPDRTTQVSQAVTAPLGDLNLVRAPIPPVLHAAQKAPYAVPAAQTCAGLTTDIHALDVVLGADLDIPPTPSNPGLIERGAAGDAAVGAIRGAAEGVIPFRGWVRKLTGAERYSREVAGAIAAGTVRRAFLKGLGQSLGCQPPAAPISKAS